MKVSRKILLPILILTGVCAPRCGATVYSSNGSLANVQALVNVARDGDTITLPAGTFSWTSVLTVTKGIKLQGATTITGLPNNPVVTDTTIIQDYTPRSGPDAGIVSAQVNASQSFRLTGMTFRYGGSTVYGGNGAIQVASTGPQPNSSVRIDHCHFDHLYWGYSMAIYGWIYGVDDHNVFDCNAAGLSHLIWHNAWAGQTNGNGSWADFPYYGTEKFWFVEDNTIRGNGPVTSGAIDCMNGGRFVARHNAFFNASPGGHGTEGGPQRGARGREVYDNAFNWTVGWGGHGQRSGGGIWHDNAWTGIASNNQNHTALTLYREIGAIGNNLSYWGLANGNNPWDVNDPHGLYESGTDTSSAHSQGTVHDSSKHWATNQWAGYSVTNKNPASACYLHSSYIISNTSNTITYYYYGSGDRGAPLVFNTGDTYAIYRVLTALDQNGRGKGDLISATSPPAWPNEALEPCFSWNNVHSPTGHAYGFGSGSPTEIANRDYYNLGAGFVADTIPSQVSSTYTAALNGVDYVSEFVYPHPLVVGVPRAVIGDFNGDGSPDFVLQQAITHETAIWYLNDNVFVGSAYGPTLPNTWTLTGAADFDQDGHSDYALIDPAANYTAIAYMSGPTLIGAAWAPILPGGWELVGEADFNGDTKPDYVLYNAATSQTAIWYLNNNVLLGTAWGPTLPSGWVLLSVADFDGDGHPDFALLHPKTGYTAICYLSGPTVVGASWGPAVPSGWILVGTADFDGDGNPDYLLYKPGTHETAIWYLNNNVFVNSAAGPTLPAAWSWVEP